MPVSSPSKNAQKPSGQLVIVLVGLARSGKDAVAKRLRDKHGFDLLVFSDILREECRRCRLEPVKINCTKIAGELRKKHGMGVLGKLILPRIRSRRTVISGGRSPEEIDELKKRFTNTVTLEVFSSHQKRFERRTEADPQTRKEFFARDKIDIQNYGMGRLIRASDFRIKNNSTLAELYKNVDRLTNTLVKEIPRKK